MLMYQVFGLIIPKALSISEPQFVCPPCAAHQISHLGFGRKIEDKQFILVI